MLQKRTRCVIAIDCMGGDRGCEVTIPGGLRFLRAHSDATLLMCGDETEIRHFLGAHTNDSRIIIRHTPEKIGMGDSLETALRRKRNSSLHVALQAVKDGEADVCVSAGNTAALVSVSRYILKTLSMVERPALCALLPNKKGQPTFVLDLGANVGCSPIHLEQFALMGAVFASVSEGITPRVGLVNVGSEEGKGDKVVRSAYDLLQEEHAKGTLNFSGFVEGNDIFSGEVDVVVADGFAGNVALKAIEGFTVMIKLFLREAFRHNWLTRFSAIFAMSTLRLFEGRLNNARYNGACLLGLRGLVYKSHGSASSEGFAAALERAYEAVGRGLLEKISQQIRTVFGESGEPEPAAKDPSL